MICTSEAIVLHSRRFGDTSRIVVLYTRDAGKLSVVAKGVRTPKSAFGSALEPLSHSRVTYYHRKNRDLHTASAAEVATTRHRLHGSYDHLSTGLSMCETVLRTQADEEPHEQVFDLLRNALETLECEDDNCYRIGLTMRLGLAELMGFAVPHGIHPPGLDVSLSDIAFETIQLSLASLHDSENGRGLVHPVITDDVRLELESFIQNYFSYHLDKRINTRSSNMLLSFKL